MASFRLKPEALADLNDIGDYTLEKWGEEQEEVYLASLYKAFSDIADHPYSGSSYEHVRERYRKYIIGKHLIFYRVLDSEIEIVRVLHHSMDIDHHL